MMSIPSVSSLHQNPFGITIGKSRSRRASKTNNNVHLHRIVNNHPLIAQFFNFFFFFPFFFPTPRKNQRKNGAKQGCGRYNKMGNEGFWRRMPQPCFIERNLDGQNHNQNISHFEKSSFVAFLFFPFLLDKEIFLIKR